MTLDLKNLKLPALHRSIDFERDAEGRAAKDDSGRFRVALSSEAPVERWFGNEILDHTKAAIDMARFKRGLPLLVNHDTNDQVGVIEEPEIGDDRKLRGWARFGRSARAAEIKQDVEDGIRKEMSVGYRVKKMVLEESDKTKGETYRATRWEPMEGSIVPVPADIEVGIGRSGDEGALPVEIETLIPAPETGATREDRMPEAPPAAPAGALKAEVVDRSEGIREIAALAKEHKMEDKLPGWIADGKSKDQVSREIMDVLTQRAIDSATTSGNGKGLDLSPKEAARYSLTRAILASASKDWRHAGLEKEVSDEMRKRAAANGYHGNENGFFVDSKLGAARVGDPLSTRTTNVAGTSSLGGAAVFTEPQSFIELLRNAMFATQAGARMLTGLQGPISFPRQNAAATASWTAEAPGSAVSQSNLTLNNLTMNPTALQASVAYSRQLLIQATPDIDAVIRQDIALLHALAIDLAAIAGTGSTQPTGILNTASIGSVAIGSNGGAVAYSHVVSVEKVQEVANALRGSLAYMTTPGQKYNMRLLTKLTNTVGMPVWDGAGPVGNINGYNAYATNQVPSNLTKGTSTTVCHAIIFGNWQELFIGEWGAFEIITDPYTLADKNSIKLVSFQLVDIGVRHAASFTAIQDAT